MTETRGTDDHERDLVADYRTMAERYDALRSMEPCARRLVELAAIPPGAQVLDIATGTGWVALAAAERVGPTGRVLGVDQSPEMLARAQKKVTAAGLSNIEFRAGDAARLDLKDEWVDVVLCASALWLLPDMLAALKEWHRVLKPGGQVAFSGQGSTLLQPLLDLWDARVRHYGVSVPPPSQNQRLLAATETCRRLLHEAGFVQTEVQSEQLGYYFRTVEEYWEEISAGRRGLMFLQLTPAQREQFKTENLAEVQALATAQGIWRDGAVHFARGWKRTA
jgi:ubiquinone/menaquinone biosynthesis C-methylase UbiE